MHHHGGAAARFMLWEGIDSQRLEACEVELADDGLRARGTQIGTEPVPYRLRYELDATRAGFVTRTLTLETVGQGWERRLRLARDEGGEWTAEVGGAGEGLEAPGGDTEPLAEALDCDIAFSPLTNTMPILRHRLHEREGTHTLVMAWVSVPDLSLHASRQHYTHVGRQGDRATVRYESESRDFVAELAVRADGLVVDYPQLAAVPAPARAALGA